MSEIQSLNSQVEQLGRSFSTWNRASLIFVALTAIAALGYFITSYVANRKADGLAQSQSVLLKEKDAQLAGDLAEKDARIGEAQERASKADLQAGEANRRAEEARLKSAELEQRNLETVSQIETLRAKNLEFEKAVSPRVLEQNLTAQKLKRYLGISFLVVSLSDFEPKRTAGQIRFMLAQAGWKRLTSLLKTESPFFDGVVVHAALSSEHVINAADGLVSVLNENGIEARRGYPVMELGPSAVLVEVGPKPLPPSLRLKPEKVKADEHGNKVWGNIME